MDQYRITNYRVHKFVTVIGSLLRLNYNTRRNLGGSLDSRSNGVYKFSTSIFKVYARFR